MQQESQSIEAKEMKRFTEEFGFTDFLFDGKLQKELEKTFPRRGKLFLFLLHGSRLSRNRSLRIFCKKILIRCVKTCFGSSLVLSN